MLHGPATGDTLHKLFACCTDPPLETLYTCCLLVARTRHWRHFTHVVCMLHGPAIGDTLHMLFACCFSGYIIILYL